MLETARAQSNIHKRYARKDFKPLSSLQKGRYYSHLKAQILIPPSVMFKRVPLLEVAKGKSRKTNTFNLGSFMCNNKQNYKTTFECQKKHSLLQIFSPNIRYQDEIENDVLTIESLTAVKKATKLQPIRNKLSGLFKCSDVVKLRAEKAVEAIGRCFENYEELINEEIETPSPVIKAKYAHV